MAIIFEWERDDRGNERPHVRRTGRSAVKKETEIDAEIAEIVEEIEEEVDIIERCQYSVE